MTTHPDFELAKKQMRASGGMLSFELEGGFDAAVKFRLILLGLLSLLGTSKTNETVSLVS